MIVAGPVLEVEAENLVTRHFRLVGIVSAFVPSVDTWTNTAHGYSNHTLGNSGYSIAVSTNPILELLKSF